MSRFARSTAGGLILSLIIGALAGLGTLLLLIGTSQAEVLDASPPLPAGWGECAMRAVGAALALVFFIEVLRWVVPGWERDNGAKLNPSAKRVLFALVLVMGQAAAWLQWPDKVFVRTPWPGEYWPAAGAGLVVSAAALLFNELLWKRIARYMQDRFGVAPRRVKARASVPPAALLLLALIPSLALADSPPLAVQRLAGVATASLPACGAASTGHLLFDSTANQTKRCNGSAWVAVASGDVSCSACVALGSEVAGTLPQGNGGTGAGALTCTSGQALTSNGSAYSCTSTITASEVTCTGCVAASELASTAVSPGSFTNASITVDQQGRLTAASSGTAPVTSVGATSPVASSGGTTPTISLGTVGYANGGTGATSFTQHGVVVAGASALSTVAPGTSGNVLTSNGTDWVSSAAASGGGFTRTAVTGDATLTGSANQHADVTTLGANLTVTLPTATSGQIVVVSDSTGTAASNASGYIIKIAANGAETFAISGGSATALYIAEDSGSVMLAGVTSVGWRVVGGRGYGVDPRSITGLVAWLDARRGVTFASATSRNVSSIADVSGSGLTFAQATAGNQLSLSRMPGGHAALYGNGAQYMSSGNVSLSSGATTALVLHSVQAPASDGLYHTFYAWGYSTTTGNAFASSMGTTVPDWSQYDLCSFGNGSNSSQTPRFIGYVGTVSAAIPAIRGTSAHVAAARQSSAATTVQFDGVRITQRVATAGAVAAVTNQPIWLFSEPSGAAPFIGWIGQFMLFSVALSDANLALLQADLLRQAGAR